MEPDVLTGHSLGKDTERDERERRRVDSSNDSGLRSTGSPRGDSAAAKVNPRGNPMRGSSVAFQN